MHGIEQTVGYGHIFGVAPAEPEGRPPRRKTRIGDGDEFARAEEGAGVVLAFDFAITDGDVLGGDEMEAVVVAGDAVVNMNVVHADKRRFNHAHHVVGALEEIDVRHRQVRALIKKEKIGSLISFDSGGWRPTAHRRMKPLPGAFDHAGPSTVTFFAPDCEDERQLPSSSAVSPCSGMASTPW